MLPKLMFACLIFLFASLTIIEAVRRRSRSGTSTTTTTTTSAPNVPLYHPMERSDSSPEYRASSSNQEAQPSKKQKKVVRSYHLERVRSPSPPGYGASYWTQDSRSILPQDTDFSHDPEYQRALDELKGQSSSMRRAREEVKREAKFVFDLIKEPDDDDDNTRNL